MSHTFRRHSLEVARGGQGIRTIVKAIFYLLRTAGQWRLLPKLLPVFGYGLVVFSYAGTKRASESEFTAPYPLARAKAGRRPGPSVVIMDGQLVRTTEIGAFVASTGTGAWKVASGTS